MSKIITVTGISGSGSREFCEKYSKNRSGVKTYYTGDMIYENAQRKGQPRIPHSNIINLHPFILEDVINRTFEKIYQNLELDMKNYDRIIIDTHAQFFWNKVFYDVHSPEHLRKIPSDMFITIIDKPSTIKEKQMKTEQGLSQNHDLADLLYWQNVEANITSGWAREYDKPNYILPSKQNPLDMDSLLDNSFLVYSSFPMTDASPEATRKINEFKKRLREVRKKIDGRETPIIDPADIDIESEEGLSQREIDAIRWHTVHRDLNWYVRKSSHTIAFYPDDKTQLSKGVGDECTRAMDVGRNVYVICPRENTSPFLDIAHKVFKDEEEFFNFFEEHLKNKLKSYERN